MLNHQIIEERIQLLPEDSIIKQITSGNTYESEQPIDFGTVDKLIQNVVEQFEEHYECPAVEVKEDECYKAFKFSDQLLLTYKIEMLNQTETIQ